MTIKKGSHEDVSLLFVLVLFLVQNTGEYRWYSIASQVCMVCRKLEEKEDRKINVQWIDTVIPK